MSACDTCPKPGSCCRAITLGGGSFAKEALTPEEAIAARDAHNAFLDQAIGLHPMDKGHLPFEPLFKTQDGAWLWWCPNLNAKTGRCDDYANRPYACIAYQPGDDAMCVLHTPASPQE